MKLEYYGGDGFGGLKEKGDYMVKAKNKDYQFQSLNEAREFYDSLNESKFFWSGMELIDGYTEI